MPLWPGLSRTPPPLAVKARQGTLIVALQLAAVPSGQVTVPAMVVDPPRGAAPVASTVTRPAASTVALAQSAGGWETACVAVPSAGLATATWLASLPFGATLKSGQLAVGAGRSVTTLMATLWLAVRGVGVLLSVAVTVAVQASPSAAEGNVPCRLADVPEASPMFRAGAAGLTLNVQVTAPTALRAVYCVVSMVVSPTRTLMLEAPDTTRAGGGSGSLVQSMLAIADCFGVLLSAASTLAVRGESTARAVVGVQRSVLPSSAMLIAPGAWVTMV